jgi:hypothetical protein
MLKCLTIPALLVLSLLVIEQSAKTEEKSAPSEATVATFDKLKALSGEWEIVKTPGGHGHHGGSVDFKVTAAGSAVVETLFTGTEHEMMTIFYVEGDSIAMTHYCMLHNRPLMREEKQPDTSKIVLKCGPKENAAIEKDDHMHQVTYTFLDNNRVKADWVMYKGGKPDSTHSFEFTRKNKAT